MGCIKDIFNAKIPIIADANHIIGSNAPLPPHSVDSETDMHDSCKSFAVIVRMGDIISELEQNYRT